MRQIVAAYNAPAHAYICYREGLPAVQVLVTDVEIDAEAGHLESHQQVREQIARELGAAKLPPEEPVEEVTP